LASPVPRRLRWSGCKPPAHRVPRTASLEPLQATREGRGDNRSAEIERNVEISGVDLTEQDRDRARVLELDRSIAREGPDYSIWGREF
jgi:hypothetical protein